VSGWTWISSQRNLPPTRPGSAKDGTLSRRLATLLFTAILFGAATLAVRDPAHAQARPRSTVPTPQGAPAEASRFRISVRSKADGRPIAKAVIRFLEPKTGQRFEIDANGIALLAGLRPQARVLEVRAEGHAAQVVSAAATEPGTTAELGFALGPGGQIRGTLHHRKLAARLG
jgi:hypothetical protein